MTELEKLLLAGRSEEICIPLTLGSGCLQVSNIRDFANPPPGTAYRTRVIRTEIDSSDALAPLPGPRPRALITPHRTN